MVMGSIAAEVHWFLDLALSANDTSFEIPSSRYGRYDTKGIKLGTYLYLRDPWVVFGRHKSCIYQVVNRKYIEHFTLIRYAATLDLFHS